MGSPAPPDSRYQAPQPPHTRTVRHGNSHDSYASHDSYSHAGTPPLATRTLAGVAPSIFYPSPFTLHPLPCLPR